jgi:hypothetical protein
LNVFDPVLQRFLVKAESFIIALCPGFTFVPRVFKRESGSLLVVSDNIVYRLRIIFGNNMDMRRIYRQRKYALILRLCFFDDGLSDYLLLNLR